MNPTPELSLLLDGIREGYINKAWHGPNLAGSIRGLTAKEAAWRPGNGRHNIWEIVVHCAYWKYAVRRRLLGEKRGSFPLKGSNWFRCPDGQPSEGDWRQDVKLLREMHYALIEAVEAMRPSQLDEISRGGTKVSNRRMIAGIAMHDVYHAGQVQLLKRLR
ncbi:MAG TPA: DinB family protein [Bacteroidota bacterium]|jgi:uncharacterized damage-inducible protein DinB|nr:DinB family protein [Bacteroidota bacterium]